MITRCSTISNNNVLVALSFTHQAVTIYCLKSDRVRTIGFDGIEAVYAEFYNNMTDDLDYDTAETFFKPINGFVNTYKI